MAKINPNKIVISRTDSIGDVVLTLPVAGILKKKFPKATIIFLGNTYTKPIIESCEYVDDVWEWAIIEGWSYDQQVEWLQKQGVDVFLHIFPRKEIARLASKANVSNRIGTSHRAYHIMTCNHLVNFSRRRSELHEAQLNTKLLAPLGIKKEYSLDELTNYIGFTKIPDLAENVKKLIDPNKKSVIIHPKSRGSAIEWGVEQFMQLAKEIDQEKFQVFFTGTEKEAAFFRVQIPNQKNMVDLSGKLSLYDLIAFINECDYLVAASTGPLHIAGVCGVHAIGLFADVKPIHPGRWQPLGKKVSIVISEKKSEQTQPLDIEVRDVLRVIQ